MPIYRDHINVNIGIYVIELLGILYRNKISYSIKECFVCTTSAKSISRIISQK